MGDDDGMDGMGGEGYDIAAAQPKKRSAPAAATSEVNVNLEMEKVLEKLKLLDYENRFLPEYRIKERLTRTYFAMPASNPHEQLVCFNSLVAWLLNQLDRNFQLEDYQDPIATAGSII